MKFINTPLQQGDNKTATSPFPIDIERLRLYQF